MRKTGPSALLGRLGGFSASLVFSTAVNLIAIPFVIVNLGAEVWGQLAVVMSTAAVIGIFVGFGWGTVGAATTAGTPERERPLMYLNSFTSRSYLFLFAVLPAVAVSTAITNLDLLPTVIATTAYLLPFVGATWYFVGESKPWRLFILDVLPQGLGTVAGTVSTFVSHEVWTYVAFQLLFNLIAVVGSVTFIGRLLPNSSLPLDFSLSPAMRRLRDQWHGVVAAGTGTINSNGPLIAVTLIAPASLPIYALADKLLRYGIAAFGPVLQLIQGWIPAGGASLQDSRVRRAAVVAPVFGLVGGIGLTAFMPLAAQLLSAGHLAIDISLTVPFGMIFCSVLVAQIIGLACLIPIGKGRELATSTAIGAALTVVVMVVLGRILGAPGVAWGAAAGEVMVALYQLNVVRQYFRKIRSSKLRINA